MFLRKFVGRFFIGWAVGGLSAVVPLYNSEISSAAVRGTVVSIQQLAIVTGVCVSFWVGYGTNYISDSNSVSWRLCLAIQGVPALMLCAGCGESAVSLSTRASLISVD
jgi:MFS family permease